ncbi:Jsn1p KNAG_0D01440 [Huiozyma naganishii CBS 8797]|uniref:PUM-HD domain-containing protein n=1 Tax=Huiozyma naganishii (strain ATCC MYA-139 / BCRC 22969 / CBS 8797 / KCTC 17520 / NBRC 10181 / NCYC 3082 / Yp74L-3) TaxID=1071383 RepID=J7S6P9_HUIN7|nr:hypothetical protein KNAG_0D01440 [Kazachstania naganishii CBS 8797]CCK69896.1 hypothetical protein KNAG_0D01440 [Kazachstania naganishii CBS 8797]
MVGDKKQTNATTGGENANYNGNNLINIPEVIDPGITIPIYEEDVILMEQAAPQKLGSYRARAGKFSNTLSNLLPSISAKLHHSKKGSKSNEEDGTSQANTSNTTSSLESPNSSMSMPGSAGSRSGNVILTSNTAPLKELPLDNTKLGHLTPPQEVIHFPDSTNHMLDVPRTSSDSFTFSSGLQPHPSRTRNNTMSSQLTSLSQGGTANNIWSTNINAPELPQHALHHLPTNTTNKIYYDALTRTTSNILNDQPGIAANNVINNLTVPGNSSVWSSNRPRSLSNASSIYMDAQLYEHNGRPRAGSSYGHNPNQIPLGNSMNTTGTNDPPFVCDDIDPRSINWVSTDPTVPPINQIASLLPTNTISISNVYPLQLQQPHLTNAINLTSTSLATLCSQFGEVKSARTLRGINVALVELDSVDSAVRALGALQGKEVSMTGAPSSVYFAKILPMHHHQVSQLSGNQQNVLGGREPMLSQPLLQEQLFNGAVTFQQQGNVSVPVFNQYYQQTQQPSAAPPQHIQQSHHQQGSSSGAGYQSHGQSYASHGNATEKEHCPFPLPPPVLLHEKNELENIISSFEVSPNAAEISTLLNKSYDFKGTVDITDFGPLPEPVSNKAFDAPKLRELRKSIDSDSLSQLELEQLAICMLDELPELSSDYLGNTVVQKMFEKASDIIKDIMLRKTSKYLTSMGVHKNGTWACQKIITRAKTPRQIMLVTKGIESYCVPLFTDQFGNYVIQCVLKFGFPWNSFIFESITANFWTIVQNRYGARAVRACLEAHDIVTPAQTLVLSSMIVLYAKYLATNSNSTLLLTWFLDTCVLSNRHSILVPRLTPYIVELCRHRLASLTILKILNYRGDDTARKTTLKALFGDYDSEEPPTVLKQILSDSSHGPTFIYKVLSMPLLEDDLRSRIVKKVCRVLQETPSAQQHRRLMEEVGLTPSTNATTGGAQPKHRKSGSHPFGQDNATHGRGQSMSSVRSNGSRQHQLAPTNGSAVGTQPTVAPSGGVGPTQGAGIPSGLGYYNYPGMFPAGGFPGPGNAPNMSSMPSGNVSTNGSGRTSHIADEISSQLDMFYLGNDTHISLPQLSVTNHSNGPNGPKGNGNPRK